MTEQLGKTILKTFEKLVNNRLPLDTEWHSAFRYSYPYRGQGFVQKHQDGIASAVTAKKEQATLFDSTATDSIRLLSSSVLSALTPPHSQWFSLAINNTEDEDIPHDAKEWLEDAAERIFQNIHASNYDAQALEFFTDVMVGGMAGLYVEKRDGKYFFEVWPLASLYCQDTLGNGFIDTVFRRVTFTAAEAINRFKKVPEHIQEDFDKDPFSTKLFDFVHTIRPRLKGGKKARGKFNKDMPYESIYVCKKSGEVVSESGFHEMPVIVPRWMRIPDTDYAYGPMQDALPDTKTLNLVVEYMLQAAEMAISGMFVAKDDGVFNPNTARVGARRIWMVSDPNNIKPLASGGDINFAVAEISRLQAQVRRTLLADQLGPSEKSNMTATEIQTRTNLIRQILGPIFGRLQAEYLAPLITRCFGLAIRDGDLGTPPESIQGMLFNIAYRSPLARAQKQQDLQAIDQFEARLAQKMQLDPTLADLYDAEKATRRIAELLGVDIDLMRDEMAVKKIKEDRAKAQQQAAMAQAMQAIQTAKGSEQPGQVQAAEPLI